MNISELHTELLLHIFLKINYGITKEIQKSKNLYSVCLTNNEFKNLLLDDIHKYHLLHKLENNYYKRCNSYINQLIRINNFYPLVPYLHLSNKTLKIIKQYLRYLLKQKYYTSNSLENLDIGLDLIDYIEDKLNKVISEDENNENINSLNFFKNARNELFYLVSKPIKKQVLKNI